MSLSRGAQILIGTVAGAALGGLYKLTTNNSQNIDVQHMKYLQKQFDEFHDAIELRRFEHNSTLREKRDIILSKLQDRLPEVFEEHDEELPDYDTEDLGSYAMGTGNKPVDEDFDIDQGIFFHVPKSDYDPVAQKERIHQALDGHTEDVEIRRSCVTIWYQRDGEPIYHVDLAVFADGGLFGTPYIAKGRESSGEEYRFWEKSDPVGLIEEVEDRFEGTDRAQFRRIVRYLKRWKDENFSSNGNQAPISVGLTVAAYRWMTNEYFDDAKTEPNDHSSLLGLVEQMLSKYRGPFNDRLKVKLPVEPHNDLFGEMTDQQQEKLKERLETLRDALQEVRDEPDPHSACQTLEKVFGDDFPVPEKEETAQKQDKPYASSSTAA
jgi:hypothetical protein